MSRKLGTLTTTAGVADIYESQCPDVQPHDPHRLAVSATSKTWCPGVTRTDS